MNDDFLLELQILVNLAEVSNEANAVLERIKVHFRKEARDVLSRYGVKMAYQAPPPSFMSEKEYKSIDKPFDWKVFMETKQGGKRIVGSGKAASIADATYWFTKVAYKNGARFYRVKENTYVGPGVKISIEIKQRKHAKNDQNHC